MDLPICATVSVLEMAALVGVQGSSFVLASTTKLQFLWLFFGLFFVQSMLVQTFYVLVQPLFFSSPAMSLPESKNDNVVLDNTELPTSADGVDARKHVSQTRCDSLQKPGFSAGHQLISTITCPGMLFPERQEFSNNMQRRMSFSTLLRPSSAWG
ncbi:uncharacterized protein E0L32_000283 [Thyridium curvatum]|uniref:Uncharacterized protein n=1 Tax=Thyridium curvatum TaxID=1093900 RepID=A0A507BF80_9PEZI|nr:uncharacterized protein E0L32_000283 [Thyridium curvatum]TPX15949.1 hypothetical protein E0L32_000283 [Thyridium curvatum]